MVLQNHGTSLYISKKVLQLAPNLPVTSYNIMFLKQTSFPSSLIPILTLKVIKSWLDIILASIVIT
jgi:hypothetical protein